MHKNNYTELYIVGRNNSTSHFLILSIELSVWLGVTFKIFR